MQQSIIKTFIFSILAFGITSCLKKDAMNIDPGKGPANVVEFENTGNNLASANSTYPGFYTDLGVLTSGASAKFNLNVSYSGVETAPEDITVNIAPDQAALDAYNSENGTDYVIPPSTVVNFPTSIVIKKGTRIAQTQVTITTSPDYDYNVNYALPLKIVSASKGTVSSNFGKAVYSFGVRNIYDGHYSLKGYTLRAGDAARTGNFVRPSGMNLVTVGGNIVQFEELQVWADLSGVGIGNPQFTVNTDNSVTITSPGGAYNAPGYNSRYDPATKTFYVSFAWGAGPASRLATDTLTYLGPR
jgi:hypothetical protein